MQIPVINQSPHPLPAYESVGAAGMDIRAWIPEGSITLSSLERRLITTGIYLQIPEGHEAQIRPRSGLAVKQGITLLNTPGTIDCDYRGEVKILLVNFSGEDQTIKNGDRIAQMIIARYERAVLQPATELEDTSRGAGGFGHTGHQ